MKKPIVVFITGRPGAGKDTQANFLAKHFNLIRISTSDLLKEKLYGDQSDNPKIKKEKEIFESGVLNTPSWVLSVVKEYVQKLAESNFKGKNGIIFSGSPRTKDEVENLVPFVEKIFGKENIFVFYLDIPEEAGIERIIERNKKSPRSLDENKEKLKIRTREFNERTGPVLEYFKDRGLLISVDGTPTIKKINKNLSKILKERL